MNRGGHPSFSDHLLEAARSLWEAQVGHPFVQGIGDGSLEEQRFRRWVLQDYVYLKEFARVFAWAVTKADRLDAMSWHAAVLHLTLNTEMELHRQYAGRFGISTEELESVEMWPTTRAYTDFLVRTAADGDLADLTAALLPCSWGYVYIAQRLTAGGLSPDLRYRNWIEQYASPEFVAAADWLKNEMNRLAEAVGEEKRARLRELFILSSRYEWQFWEMCWQGESWSPESD
jgi:thiaminase/transcriptional activator TenA